MLDMTNVWQEIREEERTQLPIYFPPPVYYSLNSAVNLSVLLTIPEAHKWFCNCMIQLAFHKDWKTDREDHPLDIYPANMIRIGRHGGLLFAYEHVIDVGGTILKAEREAFMEHVMKWINNGLYILSYADVSKMPGTKYYGGPECVHDFMVFGYHKADKTVKTMNFNDREQLDVVDISFQNLEDAVYSRLGRKVFTLLMPRKRQVYEFDTDLFCTFLSDYLNGRNTAKRYAHFADTYGEYWWGLEIYEPFQEFIEYSHENLDSIDYRPFHALYEHKKSFLGSMQYIRSIYSIDDSMEYELKMEKLVRDAEMLRMMALKYRRRKSGTIVRRMNRLLSDIAAEEKDILQRYEAVVNTIRNSQEPSGTVRKERLNL